MTVDFLPDPKRGALNKFNILFPNFNPYSISSQNSMINTFKKYLNNDKKDKNNNNNEENLENSENLSLKDSPILAFISKMVPINIKNINDETDNNINFKQLSLTDKNSEIRYMAFARNYCGTIKKGQEYFVIGPKHDPKSNHYDIKKFKFDKLYLLIVLIRNCPSRPFIADDVLIILLLTYVLLNNSINDKFKSIIISLIISLL